MGRTMASLSEPLTSWFGDVGCYDNDDDVYRFVGPGFGGMKELVHQDTRCNDVAVIKVIFIRETVLESQVT